MSIKINGKPFDFDSTELYEAESPPKRSIIFDILFLSTILFTAFQLHPYIVFALKFIFSSILRNNMFAGGGF